MDRKTMKRKTRAGTGASFAGSGFRVVYGARSTSFGKRNSLEKLREKSGRRRFLLPAVLLAIAAVLAAVFLFILQYFHVENIYVEGNLHYTSDEIIQMVTGQRFGDNSLYLALKYRDRGIQDIPFIQTMDVDVLSPDTINITVYERSVAGYVK